MIGFARLQQVFSILLELSNSIRLRAFDWNLKPPSDLLIAMTSRKTYALWRWAPSKRVVTAVCLEACADQVWVTSRYLRDYILDWWLSTVRLRKRVLRQESHTGQSRVFQAFCAVYAMWLPVTPSSNREMTALWNLDLLWVSSHKDFFFFRKSLPLTLLTLRDKFVLSFSDSLSLT